MAGPPSAAFIRKTYKVVPSSSAIVKVAFLKEALISLMLTILPVTIYSTSETSLARNSLMVAGI